MCWIVRSFPSASLTFARTGLGAPGSLGSPRGCGPVGLRGTAGGPGGGRIDRLAIPARVVEMMVRLHEIVDREVILALVQPRATADDLLELDHGIDRSHQDDVADIARIHAGRELLRGGENGRDGLFVVLKVAQVLIPEASVLGGHALAIVRISALLHLVDEIAHRERMLLEKCK